MSSLENQQWFVLRSNGQDGPFDPYEFNDRIENGDIESSALVWREGLDKWVPCNERNSNDHAARYAAVAAIEATLRKNSVAALLENGARAIASRDSIGAPLDFAAAKSIATLISANAKEETLSEIAWLDVSQGLAEASVLTAEASARKYFGRRNVSAVVAAALVVVAISSFLGRKTLPELSEKSTGAFYIRFRSTEARLSRLDIALEVARLNFFLFNSITKFDQITTHVRRAI